MGNGAAGGSLADRAIGSGEAVGGTLAQGGAVERHAILAGVNAAGHIGILESQCGQQVPSRRVFYFGG